MENSGRGEVRAAVASGGSRCWAGACGGVAVSVIESVDWRRGEGKVAMATSGGSGWVGSGGRERVSATVLTLPGVCVAVMANLKMKVSWHC